MGVYSNTYCNNNLYYASSISEAFISSCITDTQNTGSTGTNAVVSLYNCANNPTTSVELFVPNAIELSWTTPHFIPSDRTEARIDCTTDEFVSDNANVGGVTFGSSGNNDFYKNDPI